MSKKTTNKTIKNKQDKTEPYNTFKEKIAEDTIEDSEVRTISLDASKEPVRKIEAVELLFNINNVGAKGDIVPDYTGDLLASGSARKVNSK